MSDWKTLDEFKDELLKDPDFKSKFDEREPDYLIAREIIAARKAGGLTQEDLAKSIGTSQSRISKWERGEETPRIDALFKIADATKTKLELSFVPSPDRSSRKGKSKVRGARTGG